MVLKEGTKYLEPGKEARNTLPPCSMDCGSHQLTKSVQRKALCLILQQYGHEWRSSPQQEYQFGDGDIEVSWEFRVYEAHRKLQWHLYQLQPQVVKLPFKQFIYEPWLAYLFIQKNRCTSRVEIHELWNIIYFSIDDDPLRQQFIVGQGPFCPGCNYIQGHHSCCAINMK